MYPKASGSHSTARFAKDSSPTKVDTIFKVSASERPSNTNRSATFLSISLLRDFSLIQKHLHTLR